MQKRFSLSMTAVLTLGLVTPSLQAAPPSIPTNQIQACITSLCGDAKTNISSSLVTENLGNIRSREAVAMSNTLMQEMKILVAQQVQVEKERVQALDLALKDPSPVKTNNKVKVLLVLLKLINEVFQNTSSLVTFGGANYAIVNEAGFASYVKGKAPSSQVALRTVLEKVGLPLFEESVRSQSGGGSALNAYLQKNYPQLSLSQALVADARALSGQIKKLLAHFEGVLGETAGMEVDDELIARAASGQDLNTSEMDAYLKMQLNVSAIAKVMDPQIASAMSAYPWSFESEVALLRKSVYLQNRKQEANVIESFDLETRVATNCAAYMRYSFDGNTSALRIRKFQPILKEVKQAAEKVALRMLDAKDHAAILSSIERLDFSYPTTNEERLIQIKTALKSAQVALKRSRAALTEGNRSLIISEALADSMDSSVKSLENKLYLESDLYKACISLPLGAASDFAISFTGKISVSWYSLAFPDRGASILAHEIGHVLSGNIRRLQTQSPGSHAKFSESLTCVANRNPFLNEPVKLSGTANSKWSEEDWADHFSALVMDELAANGSPLGDALNKACSLVDNTDNYSKNTLSPAEGDTHSSGVLRLLMVAKDRNRVTPQCQQIIEQLGPSKVVRCQ